MLEQVVSVLFYHRKMGKISVQRIKSVMQTPIKIKKKKQNWTPSLKERAQYSWMQSLTSYFLVVAQQGCVERILCKRFDTRKQKHKTYSDEYPSNQNARKCDSTHYQHRVRRNRKQTNHKVNSREFNWTIHCARRKFSAGDETEIFAAIMPHLSPYDPTNQIILNKETVDKVAWNEKKYPLTIRKCYRESSWFKSFHPEPWECAHSHTWMSCTCMISHGLKPSFLVCQSYRMMHSCVRMLRDEINAPFDWISNEDAKQTKRQTQKFNSSWISFIFHFSHRFS